MIKIKNFSSSQMALLRIMAEANREELDFEKIKNIVEREVALSYKLLRYINSAFYHKLHNISSIKQALIYLGEKETRRFISVVALGGLISDKPDELIRTSFIRAKFLEKLAETKTVIANPSDFFTLGLFSLIDAIFDRPMESVMEKLPLSGEIVDALVSRAGPLSAYLTLVEKYERGDWEGISMLSATSGLDEEKLPALFLQACQWGNALMNESGRK